MDSTVWVSLITTAGVVLTAIIQGISAKKNDSNKKELQDIRKDLKKETLSRCKNDLIALMSRIQNGYVPTIEEKMILHETKAYYNSLGGDSYVDDMFDSLRKEGKI